MALTVQQKKAREGKLTASAVGSLMSGDQEKILNLWRELIGDPAYVAEDLSEVWPVCLGNATEALHLWWLERKRNGGTPYTFKGTVHTHPALSWAAATTDGWDEQNGMAIEVKHVGGFESREVVRARYMPQLHWTMIVTGTKKILFSVIEGAREPNAEIVDYDDDYGDELMIRAKAFMECVWNLQPPVALAPVAPPVKAVKVYDFNGKNEWASEAAVWLDNYKHIKVAESAEKNLKKMVPADGQKAFGHGIEITRDKANRLSLREIKQ